MMRAVSPEYIPEGKEEGFDLTITEQGFELRPHPLGIKWFSVVIINDDDNNLVNVCINDQPKTSPMKIRAKEHREKNMGAPLIWRVYLETETGKTAKVRVETLR